MANKRMFNIKITESDAFLDMPLSTQCLYFHLNMNADDDGFVGNPKKICRIINAGEDDLKLLIAKRFILVFENGVIVIKHWRMHNTILADRYTPTVYQEEKNELFIKENKAYTLNPVEQKSLKPTTENSVETKCLQNVTSSVNNLETNCKQNVNADIDLDLGIDLDLDLDINNTTLVENNNTDCNCITNNVRACVREGQLSADEKTSAISRIVEHLQTKCHTKFYFNSLTKGQNSKQLNALQEVVAILTTPETKSDVTAVLQLTEEELIKIVNKLLKEKKIDNTRAYVWTCVYNFIGGK